ncbi:MAG: LysR family transcriptional regulator [Cyclobacteriaceae bacterium]|nr:LysR family transcriptional regulator [Cyclobacteriaceae bacterium HetDA_MAG_MS6]
MEIRHLKLLEAVAAEGNLSKVVDRLNVSASALSHQLKEVEQELGLPLFHRVNKKLVLTDAGRILLKSAEVILGELKHASCSLMELREGYKGELRISTECYTCYHWLPGVMKSFSQEFPGVEVSIHPEYTRNPIATLMNGKIDAVITSMREDHPGLVYHELFRDEQYAVVAKGHPWESKPYVEAEDFRDQNVIIYHKPVETVSLFTQLLIPNNVTPKKITELELTEAQIEMVKAGYGVKVIAKWAVDPYLKTQPIVALPITKSGLTRIWYLVTLKQELPKYFESFRQSLMSHMRA